MRTQVERNKLKESADQHVGLQTQPGGLPEVTIKTKFRIHGWNWERG